MSYAAEPYAQFVDDLLTALTGGVSREQFVFLPEDGPYRLAPPGPLIKSTLRVFGQAERAFAGFQADRDFGLEGDLLTWKVRPDGTPAADAVWIQAINDPTLSASARANLIEDLNEDGLQYRNLTTADLPVIRYRLELIEDLRPYAMDKVNADAFDEARKDLVNMEARLTGR